MQRDDRLARLKESWERNADRWRDAVRDDLIPSRSAVTNRAVLEAAVALGPRRVLDMGCGEGWLLRALDERLGSADENGAPVLVGADGSSGLIAAARQATGRTDGNPNYLLLDYEDFITDPFRAGGPFDLIVCNFSLLDDRVAEVLAASRHVLAHGGAILVQTVHPRTACGDAPNEDAPNEDAPNEDAPYEDAPYEDGWRTERFEGFSGEAWQAMPWYFRTLESWMAAIAEAGLAAEDYSEPLDPIRGVPASLLLVLKPVR